MAFNKFSSIPDHILAQHALNIYKDRLTSEQIESMSEDECRIHNEQFKYDSDCMVELFKRMKSDLNKDDLERLAIVPVPRKMKLAELKKSLKDGLSEISKSDPYWYKAGIVQTWFDSVWYLEIHANDAPWLHYMPTKVQIEKLVDWCYEQAHKYDVCIVNNKGKLLR